MITFSKCAGTSTEQVDSGKEFSSSCDEEQSELTHETVSYDEVEDVLVIEKE